MTSTESTESRLAEARDTLWHAVYDPGCDYDPGYHVATKARNGRWVQLDPCPTCKARADEAVGDFESILLAEVAALQASAEAAEAYTKRYEHVLAEINVEIGLYRGAYGPAGREEHIAHIDSIIESALLSPPSTPPDGSA